MAASEALAELDRLLAKAGAQTPGGETADGTGSARFDESGLMDSDVIGGRSALRSAERG